MCKIAQCILGTESTVLPSCCSLGGGAKLEVWSYLILPLVASISYFLTYPGVTLGNGITFSSLAPCSPWCVHGVLTAHRYAPGLGAGATDDSELVPSHSPTTTSGWGDRQQTKGYNNGQNEQRATGG